MGFVNCLHCERPLQGRQKFCGQLCKSAEFKRLRKVRAAEDAHWATIESRPTFDLTDVECFQIEAAVASQEAHVFDSYRGCRLRDEQQERDAERINELHESWADRGAALDVWQMRRVDRARFGGIVLTPDLFAETEWSRAIIRIDNDIKWAFRVDPYNLSRVFDGLDSPDFHNKLFDFELDEIYERETGEKN